MTQKEDESLEDYLERFSFSVRKSKHSTLSEDSMKLIFLRGVNEDCVNSLELMGEGDITKFQWDDIRQIYQKYFRAATKRGRHYTPGSSISKSSTIVSRMEITHLLKEFK